VLGIVTGGWNLSGITYFSTGSPFTPGFSTSPTLDITGTVSQGARIDVVGNPFQNVPNGLYFTRRRLRNRRWEPSATQVST